jgi:hypothetical protein
MRRGGTLKAEACSRLKRLQEPSNGPRREADPHREFVTQGLNAALSRSSLIHRCR